MNKDFNEGYVVGFIDGDGCFYIATKNISKRNKTYQFYLTIGLREDDSLLLDDIKRVININGYKRKVEEKTVNGYLCKPQMHLHITSIDDINKTIKFFENIDMNNPETIRGYICGFIDAEACFSLSKNIGFFSFYFTIRLRDDDDKILDWIKEQTGVNFSIYQNDRAYGNSKPQITMYIHSKKNIKKIIDYLGGINMNPFKGKKKKDYEIWKNAFQYHITHSTGCSVKNSTKYNKVMSEYKKKLSDIKKYNNSTKKLKVKINEPSLDKYL